ncbi:MAG: hypothetical protein K8S99_03810 [Planctomycetes bacterium]|nr:hypothetical protein [Planctomycetota bacterium]
MTAYRLTQGSTQARFDSLGHLTHLGHPDHIKDRPSPFHLQGPCREGYWSVNCGARDILFDPETTRRGFDYAAGKLTLTSVFRGPGDWWGLDLSRVYQLDGDLLRCDFTLQNWSPGGESRAETADGEVTAAAPIGRLRYQTGVNSWTDYSSDWKHRPYPTSLRVERDFFWGAATSMSNDVIGWFTATKTDGWSTLYESTGDQRVRSCTIDFINSMDAHPARWKHQEVRLGRSNPKYTGTFYIGRFESIEHLWRRAADTLGVAFLAGPRYTGFTGESLEFDVIAPSNLRRPVRAHISDEQTGAPLSTVESSNGGKLSILLEGTAGRRVIELDAGGGKTTEARIWQQVDWRESLQIAARFAAESKPPSGYNAESMLALITVSQAAAYLGDERCREVAAQTLRRAYQVHYDPATGLHKTAHHRLQNYGSLLDAARIYHDCLGVTDEIDPLRKSTGQLLSLQRDDGNFYRHHVIYNNVIHPVKSLFDWSEHLRKLGFAADADRARAAAERAYRCIARAGDDTQTEGSEHFEDGMTACSAYQIASLWPHFGRKPEDLATAFDIYAKRKMLKSRLPDSRFFGGTLRHWELYWAMGLGQAMLAGHGWGAWSASLAHALFMASGRWDCLIDAYATVTNCLQSADPDTGRFHMGIVVDPSWRDYFGLGTQHAGEEYVAVPDEVRVAGESHSVFLTLHDSFYKQTYLRLRADGGVEALNGRVSGNNGGGIELDSFALAPREVVVVNETTGVLPRIMVNGKDGQPVIEIKPKAQA